MRWSPLALVALAFFTLDCVRAQEDSRQPAAESNRKFAALRAELDQVETAARQEGALVFEQRRKEGHTAARAAEGVVVFGGIRKRGEPIAERALEVVRAQPDTPFACEVLIWILESVPWGPPADRAADLLIEHHLRSDLVTELLRSYGAGFGWLERLARAQAAADLPDEQRAAARMNLAHLLSAKAEAVDEVLDDNRRAAFVALFGQRFIDELATLREQRGASKLREEAIGLLQGIAAEFPSVPAKNERDVETTYGEWARQRLDELRTLSIGMKALDSRGTDLDGQPIALSDYRGKVVVVVFWASWCAACMAKVPEEREFVERMDGRPFVMVGVNGDDDLAAAKNAALASKMNWRSFANGYRGKLVNDWHVLYWPTTFVIDHLGTIRAKNLNWKQISGFIEEAEAAAK